MTWMNDKSACMKAARGLTAFISSRQHGPPYENCGYSFLFLSPLAFFRKSGLFFTMRIQICSLRVYLPRPLPCWRFFIVLYMGSIAFVLCFKSYSRPCPKYVE